MSKCQLFLAFLSKGLVLHGEKHMFVCFQVIKDQIFDVLLPIKLNTH